MINVLIIEDDPMVAEFNKHYLEQVPGFELVGSVPSSQEALLLIEENNIDLLLLDVYMPGMHGLELLTKIRALEKTIDVIIISAASDKVSIEKALRYGVVDYLIKPFQFERFKEALLRYKKEKIYINNQELFSQKELDKLIHNQNRKIETPIQLPKGLTRNTLKIIWEAILNMKDKPFTTEEIGISLGISRVSIRKYLTFLSEIEVLEEEIIYGSVGRPQYRYKYNPSNSIIIKHYL